MPSPAALAERHARLRKLVASGGTCFTVTLPAPLADTGERCTGERLAYSPLRQVLMN